MNVILLTLGGLLGRHVLTALGGWLVTLGLPPETIQAIMGLVNVLPPTAQLVVGLLVVAGGLGWSYWQKRRSGVIS